MTVFGNRRRPGRFLLLALTLCASVVTAQDGVAAPSPLPVSPVSPGGMLQVLLGLVAVLAAIAATAWLLRRFVPGQSGAGGMLRVIGGVMVGPKERLVLVELGETWLLLGVASGHVSALHTMPKPQGQSVLGGPATREAGFAAWLRRAKQGRGGEG